MLPLPVPRASRSTAVRVGVNCDARCRILRPCTSGQCEGTCPATISPTVSRRLLVVCAFACLAVSAILGVEGNVASVIAAVAGSLLIALVRTDVCTPDERFFLAPWQIYLANWPGSTYSFRLIDILVGSVWLATLLKLPTAWRHVGSRWLVPLWIFLAISISWSGRWPVLQCRQVCRRLVPGVDVLLVSFWRMPRIPRGRE